MSNVEDYKLRFSLENEQFEQAAQTTLNTLGKLKTGLNFDGAVSGFSGITKAIGSVTFDPLANALDNISNHFNVKTLLMATGIQELERKVINSATNIINSVTFGPVTDGFKEYELKMGSVQTIMASTKEPLEVVNKYLAELNEYADKTIYSFSDMTSSIGKFTNAGVKLEDAVAAIKGISNEAALSGANAQQASHAMYNFAQALSTGYVKLIDWKSIEVANMATLEFKEQLLETALALGTVTKDADGYYHTLTTNANGAVSEAFNATTRFNDNLQYQWLTTQVLVKTLGLYANETEDIGKRAYAAAQDVKTFTQLMDTLKEAVGSGWANTFEILFGDFNQARELFTGISKAVGDLVDKSATARNEFLSAVLGGRSEYKKSPILLFFDEIFDRADQMKEAGNSVGEAIKNSESSSFFGKITNQAEQAEKVLSAFVSNDTQQGLKNTVVNLETLHSLTREILSDKYGTGENRITALTEAGYSASTVQKYINILHGLTGGTWELTEANLAAADAEFQNWLKLADLTDEELLATGLTQAEIDTLKSVRTEFDKVSAAVDNLGESTDGMTYREILIDSFKNTFTALSKVVGTVKEAFRDIFPPITVETVQKGILAFHKLTEGLIISDTTAANLKETFRGFFSIIDIIRMGIGALFQSPLFDTITKFVSAMVSAVTVGGGMLGSFITSIRDGLKQGKSFGEIFQGFTDIVEKWKNSDAMTVIEERFTSFKTTLNDFFSGLPKWASDAWAGIKDFFSDIGSLFNKAEKNTGGGFHDTISKTFKQFDELKSKATDFFFPFLNSENRVIQLLKNMGGFLKVVFLDDLPLPSIETFGNAITWLVEKIGKLKTAVTNFFSSVSLSSIGASLKDGFLGIFGMTAHAAGTDDSLDEKVSIFGRLSGVLEGAKPIFDSAINKLKEVYDWAIKVGTGLMAYLQPILSSAGEWFGDALSKLPENFTNSLEKLKTNLATIKDKVGGFLKDIVYLLGSSGFGMTAYASTADDYQEQMEGLAAGIAESGDPDASAVAKTMSLLDNIKSKWEQVKPVLTNGIQSILDFLSGFDYEKAARILSMLASAKMTSSIGTFFKSLSKLTKMGSGTFGALQESIKAFSEGLSGKGGLFSALGEAAKTFGESFGKGGIFGTGKDSIGDMLKEGMTSIAEAVSTSKSKSFLETVKDIAAAILILSAALWILASIPKGEHHEGLSSAMVALALMAVGIVGFGIAVKAFDLTHLKSVAPVVLAIGTSMLELAVAAKMFSKMNVEELVKGFGSIAVLLVELGLMIQYAFPKGSTFGASAGFGLIGLATSLIVLTGAVAIFGHMKWPTLIEGIAGVTMALGGVGLALQLFSNLSVTFSKGGGLKLSKNMISIGVGLALVSASLLVFAADIAIFGKLIGDTTFEKGLGRVVDLLASVGVALLLFSNISFLKKASVSKNMISVGAGLVLVATALTLMAVPLAALSLFKPEKIEAGAKALGGLMLDIAALTMAVSRWSKGGVKDIAVFAASMLILAPALDLLAVGLGVLSLFDSDKLLTNASVLAIMVGVMALVAGLVGTFSKNGAGDMIAFAAALIILAPALDLIAAALIAMSWLINYDKIGAAGGALALMAAGLAAMGIVTSKFITNTRGATAILELAVALAVLTPVLLVLQLLPWMDLAEGLGKLAAVLIVLGLGAAAIQFLSTPLLKVSVGFGAFALAAAAVVGVLVLIGPALADALRNFLNFKDGIIAMIPDVVRAGAAIGKAFLDGLIEIVLDGFIDFFQLVSNIPGFGKISESAIKGLESVRTALRNSLLDFDEEKALAQLGGEEIAESQIKGYAKRVTEGKGVAGRKTKEVIDEAVTEGTVAAADGGEKIGTAIYDSMTGGLTRIDLSETGVKEAVAEVVDDSINAAKEAATTGGSDTANAYFESLINEMGTADLGGALNTDNIQQALSGITDMVGGDFASNLFNSITSGAGGFGDSLSQIFGDIDAATPGAEGGNDYMGAFLASIAGGEGDANNAMNSIMASLMGTTGSFDFTSTGDDVMDDIINGLMNGSTDLNSTAGVLMGRMLDSMDIDSSIPGGNMIKEYAKGMLNSSGQATSAAKQVANASTNNLDAKQAAQNKGYGNGSSYANGMSATDVLAAAAASNISNDALVALLNTYGFNVNGDTDARAFIQGLLYQANNASYAGGQLASSAANGAYDYNGMYSAGSSTGTGFWHGLASQVSNIIATAQSLATQAKQSLMARLGIASPSKVTREIGMYAGMGFALGIKDSNHMVKEASNDVGGQAIRAIRSVQDKIAQIFDDDYKVDPTIRPILDLTDIQNGSQEIDNILGNKTVSLDGAMDNVDATISQLSNAGTGETSVVNAINGLRTDLDSLAKFVIARAAMEDETVQYSSVNVNMDGKAIGSILTSSVIERINTDQLAKLRAVGA